MDGWMTLQRIKNFAASYHTLLVVLHRHCHALILTTNALSFSLSSSFQPPLLPWIITNTMNVNCWRHLSEILFVKNRYHQRLSRLISPLYIAVIRVSRLICPSLHFKVIKEGMYSRHCSVVSLPEPHIGRFSSVQCSKSRSFVQYRVQKLLCQPA